MAKQVDRLYIDRPEEFSEQLEDMTLNTRLDLISKDGKLYSFVRISKIFYLVGLF